MVEQPSPARPGDDGRIGRARRRRSVPGGADRRVALGLVAVLVAMVVAMVVATIGRPLVGLGSLHAADTLQVLDPWAQSAAEGYRPDNGVTSDTVDTVAPVRLAVAQRARDGDLALWSTSQGGGAPLLGIPNTAMFSPLNLPWWVAPGWWAPALAKLVQMLVAGGSLFLLARRLGMSRPAALVGAAAIVDAGFLVVWTTWPQSNVAALVPALFWAVDRAVVPDRPAPGTDDPPSAGPRPSVTRWAAATIPLALVGASMWFEGFPALTLWAHLFAAAWALVRARSAGTGQVRATLATAAGMLTGLGIAAVQLVPFAFRVAELDTSTRAAKAADALPWESMATMLAPDAFGSAGAGVWYGPRNEVEVQAFLGAGALALVVAAVAAAVVGVLGRGRGGADVRGTWTRFATVAAIVTGLLTWAGGPLHDAVQALPVIGANQTGRLRGLLAVLLATLVAGGVDAVLRATPTGRRRLAASLGIGAAGLLAALAPALLRARHAAEAAGQADFASRATIVPVALFVTATVVLVLAVLAPRPWARTVGVALVVLLVAGQAVAFARGFLPRIDRDEFYPRTAAHDLLDDLVGTDRFAAGGFAIYPGTTTVYGLHSLTAHAGMPAAWNALLLEVDDQAYDRNGTFPILQATPAVAGSTTLDLLGVTYFVTELDVPVFGMRDTPTEPGRPLATGRPIHGVDVSRDVLRVLDDHDPPASLVAELLDDRGLPVASGRRRIARGEDAPWLAVPLAPTTPGAPPPTRGSIRLSVLLDPPGPPGAASRAGTEGDDVTRISAAAPEGVRIRPVRVDDGGLRVVAAPDVVVYERPDALPRIRVEAPGQAPVAAAARDDEDQLTVEVVDAPAAAVLVVADARSGGHRASVDGEPVEVTTVHDALVGVPVPPGDHRVRVWWEPEGFRPAAAVTVLCLAAVSLVGIGATLGTRRRSHATPRS